MRNRNLQRWIAAGSVLFFFAIICIFHCTNKTSGDVSLAHERQSVASKESYKPNSSLECHNLAMKNEDLTIRVEVLLREVKSLRERLNRLKHLEQVLISQDLSSDKSSLSEANFLNSFRPMNEFEVIPFDTLSGVGIYGGSTSVAKKPASFPYGRGKHEWDEVKQFAVRSLNEDVEGLVEPVRTEQIHTAITRTDKLLGAVYDMYFRSSSPNIFRRVKIARPFGPLRMLGKPEFLDQNREIVHFVMALSGRLDKLKAFLVNFVDVGVSQDNRVYLTIVHFGPGKHKETSEIRTMLRKACSPYKFSNYKVIYINEPFSRGLGLQRGIESWKRGNVLTFLCDVDVHFSQSFLDRCRFHTSPGKKIYYPIVFSLYNPKIVFGENGPESVDKLLQIKDDHGFWRDFGFGMTCFYKQDFLRVTKFDSSIKGWGMEDAKVYRQFVQSELTLIRAFDPGLIHLYHSKLCNKDLPYTQFLSCLHSKAVSEGSYKHMGMLAFGEYLLKNENPEWAQLLQKYLNVSV